MLPLYDAHCHLQDKRFGPDLSGLLERAASRGVRGMMCCGTGEEDWQSVRQLSAIEGVGVSFGLHPWYVMQRTGAWFETLEALLGEVPGACVGEIGLDHAVDRSTYQAQEEVFIRQLRLGRELYKPVSIHCRKAFGRLIEILKAEGGVGRGGLIHSYSGPPELVPALEGLGLHLSFSGSLARPENKRGHAAAAAVSPGRLLIETDSPDMPPPQAPGGPNEPANLVFVLEKMAALRGCAGEELAGQTADNARRLFGIKPEEVRPIINKP